MIRGTFLSALLLALLPAFAAEDITVEVNFNDHHQIWDGFGVNYVETAQTPDYGKWPQEYGGFSTLSEAKRQEILRMIFSDDGLKPGIIKMFLDPFQEGMTAANNDNESPWLLDQSKFDHETYTGWMRYFVREGLKMTRGAGREIEIITTLYGPPGWMTQQRFVRGRDLDPAMKYELGEYLAAWLKYLKEDQKFPVNYVSLHNEGEASRRWPADGRSPNWERGHDYNMYWPPEQVVDFLQWLPAMLAHHGVGDVKVAPGETTNWRAFTVLGYGSAIAMDPTALNNIGLVTSHSFNNKAVGGVDTIRWRDIERGSKRDLHVWVTSTSWSKMNVDFVAEWAKDLYDVKVNALIPWACIQTNTWVGGDPNPGTAFRVDREGGYTVEPGYYWYKQIARAGQPRMRVAGVYSSDEDLALMAFAKAGTRNPDAFVVMNRSESGKSFRVRVRGSAYESFDVYRTSPAESYQPLPPAKVDGGYVTVTAPARSATSFFGR